MPKQAWQPFTPRGIAAFAHSSATRLLLAQIAVAALVAVALIWFLSVAWFPVVSDAIRALPPTGEIRGATLNWNDPARTRLAENPRLAFVVDIDRTTNSGHVSDVEVTFERGQVTVCTAWRCWHQPYKRGDVFSFNRPALEPAWGARRGPLLALVAALTILSIYVMWWGLAFVYAPLVKLIAFFADRAVTWGGAWRLSAAGLLPGAMLVALALVLYGFGAVDLPRFLLLYTLHIATGLLFVVTSTLFLPKLSEKKGGNPFT
jgi:hypothetical protein